MNEPEGATMGLEELRRRAWTAFVLERPEGLTPSQESRAASLLNDNERTAAAGMGDERARSGFLIGRAVVRSLLGRALNRDPLAVDLAVTVHGKPYMVDEAGRPAALRFNVSHSRTCYLVGLSLQGDVGVDVEDVRVYRRRVAERFFDAAELSAIEALEPGQRAGAFYQLWTVKEACVKAAGLPLGPTLRRTRATLDPAGESLGFSWETLHVGGRHRGAIAYARNALATHTVEGKLYPLNLARLLRL